MALSDASFRLTAIDGTAEGINSVLARVEGVKSSLGGVGSVLSALAGAAGIGYFASLIQGAISLGAEFERLAQRTGASVEQLSNIRDAAIHAGGDMDTVTSALDRLSKSAAQANDPTTKAAVGFTSLGISVKDAAGETKNAATLMQEIAVKLEDYRDGANKVALVQELMGRAAAQNIPMFHELAQQHESLNTITAASALASHEFEKALNTLKHQGDQLFQSLIAEWLPSLTSFIEQLVEGKKRFGDFFTTLVANAKVSPFSTIGDQMTEISKKIASLEAGELHWYAVTDSGRKNAIEGFKNELAALQILQNQYAKGGLGAGSADHQAGDWKREAPNTNTAAAATTADLTGQINALNQAYLKLTTPGGGEPEFEKALDELIKLQREGKVVTEAQRVAYLSLAVQLDAAQKQAVANAATLKAWNAQATEQEKVLEQHQTQVEKVLKTEAEWEQSLTDQITTLTASNEAMGQTALQQAIIAANTRIDIDLQKEINKLRADGKDLNADAVQAQVDEATAAANSAKGQVAAQLTIGDATRTQLANTAALWSELNRLTSTFFTDLLTRGSNAFKNLGQSLKTDFIAVLYEMTAKKWIISIATSGAAGGASAAGGDSGLGGLGQLASGASSVSGMFGGPTIGSSLGLTGGIGASYSGAAAGLTAGEAALSLEASAAVGETAVSAGMIAGGISEGLMAGLAAVPVVGWVALAALIVYEIFSNMPKGGPKSGGFGAYGNTAGLDVDSNGRYYTPNNADASLNTAAAAIGKSYADAIKSLGGRAGDVGFAIGFDSDPMGKANNRTSAGATLDGRSVYDARNVTVMDAKGTGSRDQKDLEAALTTQSQRALLAALQASDLPTAISKLLNSLDVATATGEQITAILQLGAAYKGLIDITKQLPKEVAANLEAVLDNTADTFKQVAELAGAILAVQNVLNANPLDDALAAIATASLTAYGAFNRQVEALKVLSKAYDGSVSGATQLAQATVAYYSAQVTLIAQIQQVKTAIGSMFGDTIRGLTLTTLDNSGKYNFLQKEADTLRASLLAEKDPAKINDYAKRINDDINAAFGLLDTDQQKAHLTEFIDRINKLNAAVDKQLAGTQTLAENTAAATLKQIQTDLAKAASDMAAAAAASKAAAEKPLQVVVTTDVPASATVNG